MNSAASTSYKFYYHSGKFAGRGEIVRMMLNVCGVQYEDVCKE